MNGTGLIASALLILLLLPIVVATWERKRVPDALYIAIAAAGIGYAGLRDGLMGALLAGGIGLACLLLVAAAVGLARTRWGVRLLVGSHIKLLGAGATWLGAPGAATMILLALFLFIACVILLRARKAPDIRPEFAPIAAIAILAVQFQHVLLTVY